MAPSSFADGDIGRGQNVWQALGGMEVGSIWGHGSYVAPDWTADWLHREAIFVLDEWSTSEFGKPYEQLSRRTRASCAAGWNRSTATTATMPRPTPSASSRSAPAPSNPASPTSPTSSSRATPHTRFPRAACSTPERMRQFAGFIFWTVWSAAAERPGDTVSYTHNWPHEPLVGNRPTGESVLWTGVSIIMLLAGICAMVWWYASQKADGTRGPGSRDRSAGRLGGHALAARHPQVLLGGLGADPGADSDGHGDGALRRRRRRLLRHQDLAHLCPTASRGPGTCRSASSGSPPPGWPPASSSARWSAATSRSSRPRRARAVRRAAGDRRGFAGRRVDERPEQALRRERVPVGTPGLRVCGSGPRLADSAVRRSADLAVPGGAGDSSRRSR